MIRIWVSMGVCVFNLVGVLGLAQEDAASRFGADSPLIELNLDDLSWIEPAVDAAEPSVTIVTSKMKAETRTRTFLVTKTRSENRSRTMEKDGKTITVPYTVQVPYTEQREQAYTVMVPSADASPSTVALTQIVGFDISGKPLDPNRLANQLANRTAAFVLQQRWAKGTPLDPRLVAVLREDTLFLFVKPSTAK